MNIKKRILPAALALLFSAAASATPFSNVVVFGDSLSDAGYYRPFLASLGFFVSWAYGGRDRMQSSLANISSRHVYTQACGDDRLYTISTSAMCLARSVPHISSIGSTTA